MRQSKNALLTETGTSGSYSRARFAFAAFIFFAAPGCLFALEPYKLPPKEVVDILSGRTPA